MDFSGIIIGLSVFLLIGACHPLVVKAEYHIGLKSWLLFLGVGIAFAIASLFIRPQLLSIIFGAAAFSFFWGVLEVFHQEKRVLKGWFPENPKRSEYYAKKRVEYFASLGQGKSCCRKK